MLHGKAFGRKDGRTLGSFWYSCIRGHVATWYNNIPTDIDWFTFKRKECHLLQWLFCYVDKVIGEHRSYLALWTACCDGQMLPVVLVMLLADIIPKSTPTTFSDIIHFWNTMQNLNPLSKTTICVDIPQGYFNICTLANALTFWLWRMCY